MNLTNRNQKPNVFRSQAEVMPRLQHEGFLLAYVPDQWMTPALVSAAIANCGSSYPELLSWVGEQHRTESVCLEAVEANGLALEWVPENTCTEAICLKAVENEPEAVRFVPNQFMNPELARQLDDLGGIPDLENYRFMRQEEDELARER